jgi:hypothetical protein
MSGKWYAAAGKLRIVSLASAPAQRRMLSRQSLRRDPRQAPRERAFEARLRLQLVDHPVTARAFDALISAFASDSSAASVARAAAAWLSARSRALPLLRVRFRRGDRFAGVRKLRFGFARLAAAARLASTSGASSPSSPI